MTIRPFALALLVLGVTCGVAAAQPPGGGKADGLSAPESIPVFTAREATARWLLGYDWAAWKSSDELMKIPAEELRKVLGPEWYCVESERDWDCYYGKYDPAADRYLPVFHFQSKNRGQFVRVPPPPPSDEATAFGRALYVSRTALPPEFQNAGFRFNVYVRKTAAGEMEVWWLPGGQPDGTLVYGGEACHTLDASGRKILSTAVGVNQFRSKKADPNFDLLIDNGNDDIASVGHIFFVLQFGRGFKSVSIVGRRFVTRRMKGDDGQEFWANFERTVNDGRK